MVTNRLLFNCLNLRYGGRTVNFKLLKKNGTLLEKRVILKLIQWLTLNHHM